MFKQIGLVIRQNNPEIINTLHRLIDFLTHQSVDIALSDETAQIAKEQHHPNMPLEQLAQKSDLIIVIGGDGTLLGVSHVITVHDTPILGINQGRLGFLTDICPGEIEEKLGPILQGEYHEEARFLLTASLTRTREDQPKHALALNEVVLMPGQMPQMLDFEAYVNGQLMYSQRSDGLIIATPTGSTAYSLSAGGPIVHPTLNAILLAPIFPHSLTYRPIVLDGDSTIEIKIAKHTKQPPCLICDSQDSVQICEGDSITIQKFEKALRLIHPQQYDYFENLRSKLHWGKRLTDQTRKPNKNTK